MTLTQSGITIVMALYNPTVDWLRQQLLSLNAQAYPNLTLLACNDASNTITLVELQAIFCECITAFPYTLISNPTNSGSNITFATLTALAQTPLIAYCDQDDVWEPQKLQRLAESISDGDIELACSDLSIIDAQGKQIVSSITKIKPHIHYLSGEGLAPVFLTTNFVTGCALLMKTETAKAALPFPQELVYDHWLGMLAAQRGKIVSLPDALVRHRMHNTNQTHTLSGINTRDDYLKNRIIPDLCRMNAIKTRIDLGAPQREAEGWAQARVQYAQCGGAKQLIALKHVCPSITIFELIIRYLPNSLFKLLIRCMQKGIL